MPTKWASHLDFCTIPRKNLFYPKFSRTTVKKYYVFKVVGKTVGIPLEKVSEKLSTADEIQRGLYKISPAGYGIHWPLLDEDLSIASLMEFAK